MINNYSRAVLGLTAAFTFSAFADVHTAGVPQLSSRPGAAYEIYLNVAGFNYTGQWKDGDDWLSPGSTPALNDVANTGTFSAAEQEQIKLIWARVAQSYVGFNVNITTVDPAIAAGQAATDLERQEYYDTKANFMHTVIGSGLRGGTSWVAGADGTSGIAVIGGNNSYDGSRTNFMLSQGQASGGAIQGDYIGRVASHENAHAFGLNHQSDYNGGTSSAEYSVGDATAGPGSYVPIIGNADGRQRTAWRYGDSNTTVAYTGDPINTAAHQQNDIARMLSTNTGLELVDSGISHSAAAPTPMSFVGTDIDHMTAKGVIVPVPDGNGDYLALGIDNYTKDYLGFAVAELSQFDLTLHNSTDFLVAGQEDGIGTLRGTIELYDSAGTLILAGIESGDTLTSALSTQLGIGSYYVKVGSAGGHAQDSDFNRGDNDYYDMGAYFLTGSLVAVPEPSSALLLSFGGLVLVFRRRKA